MFIVGLLNSEFAHSSYLQTCVLEGVIVLPPYVINAYSQDSDEKEYEKMASSLQMTVSHARSFGRADSSCLLKFKGKTISISLNADLADVKNLKKGNYIRLQYFHKEYGYREGIEKFELLKTTLPSEKH